MHWKSTLQTLLALFFGLIILAFGLLKAGISSIGWPLTKQPRDQLFFFLHLWGIISVLLMGAAIITKDWKIIIMSIFSYAASSIVYFQTNQK